MSACAQLQFEREAVMAKFWSAVQGRTDVCTGRPAAGPGRA